MRTVPSRLQDAASLSLEQLAKPVMADVWSQAGEWSNCSFHVSDAYMHTYTTTTILQVKQG